MLAAITVLLTLVAFYVLALLPLLAQERRLLIAPMIGQLEDCIQGEAMRPGMTADPAYVQCHSPEGSAAPVIEATLSALGPRRSRNDEYELGYTQFVPLLRYLVQQGDDWVVDQVAVGRLMKSLAQTDRRVVLYLFSTHFSAPAPIEPVLAADPANMAYTPLGPLGIDKYYGMDLYPWSIARTDNSLTQRRLQVIEALSRALCAQPQAVRDRLAGITVLGETHHQFPSFETGMGYDRPYQVSDYSDTSVKGFRAFLVQRFGHIDALNAALGGASFAGFTEVSPPAKDIRREPMRNFWEHMDHFASGSLPVAGWLAPDPRLTGWLRIYLDGQTVARVHAGLGRQDVLANKPELATADVGWRYDLDYRQLSHGIHQIAVLAETRTGELALLESRPISVMDRQQTTPRPVAQQTLPRFERLPGLLGYMDQPQPSANYYYNPLAALWQEFREQQVVNYLRFMERPLAMSCLAPVPRYIHQLIPFPNPSWDPGKYGVEASLQATGDLRLGVSLYGEAGYGRSFFDWKEAHRHGPYGITEFHPLRSMELDELQRTFQAHKNHGASFLSFFLEARGEHLTPTADTVQNQLSLDPANQQNGSDRLYRSVQRLLAQP